MLIKKTLAGILAGVFLFTNTLSWAKEEELFLTGMGNKTPSSRPADNSKLAAELRTTRSDFKELYKAAAICRFIEKTGIVETNGVIYDINTLKEIINCLVKESLHPVLAAEIDRLMNEHPDQRVVSNANEYIPGPFRIKEIRNVRIIENGQNLFADYRQNILNRAQNILDLINKKVKDGSLSIPKEDLWFLNKYLRSSMSSLFNSVQAENLTFPQFEELLFVLVNMITPGLYNDIKKESNVRGMKIYARARTEIKGVEKDKGWDEALKRAVIYAALGNGLEAKYYDESLLNMSGINERLINIDAFLKGMLGKIKTERGGTILYFLDNAGEIFTDLLVVELLLGKGFNVKLVAKDSPTTDDLTVGDVNKILSDLMQSDEKEYQWVKRLEVASSGSRTPATDFNKVRPELFEGAIFSIYKGGGNHYGACPAVLVNDSFHIFMIKEPLQRAILAAEGVDKAKNTRGALVFLHRQKGDKAIKLDTLLKDGGIFETGGKAEECENLNGLSLEEVKALLPGIKDSFEKIHFVVLPYEITIEIPDEGLAVRYFDPAKANVITPYSDISRLSTKVIGPRLNRQIIHRIKAIQMSLETTPAPKTAPPAKDAAANDAAADSLSGAAAINQLREICDSIKQARLLTNEKDYRQLNQAILNLKDKYDAIKDLFLIENEGWYLQLRIDEKRFYYRITQDGISREIKQEEFLVRQLLVPDNSLFEVYDSTIQVGGMSPTWRWRDYEMWLENQKKQKLIDRAEELKRTMLKMAEANEPLGKIKPYFDEWNDLRVELERGSLAVPFLSHIEQYAGLFIKAKEIAFNKIDNLSVGPELISKLQEVKEEWKEYDIHIDDPKLSNRLTTTLLGVFYKSIIINPDLWKKILEQNDAAEITAELITRGILKGIESKESSDNFLIGKLFTNERLRQLEEITRTEARLKKKTPTCDLARILNGLSVEQKQALKFISRQDPSALFAPVSDFSWTDWDLLFSRFNDITINDGKYRYVGIEEVIKEAESNVSLRMADESKRDKYITELEELKKRLNLLVNYVVNNFDKLEPDTFSYYHWECLARMDIRIRNMLLRESLTYRGVARDIILGLLSKLRQVNGVESLADLEKASDDSRFSPLDLKAAIRSYHVIPQDNFYNRDIYAGDFFDIAAKANINLKYPDVYDGGKKVDLETMNRMRSEAMKYLISGIQRLPKALVWKLKRAIDIEIHFEPIPEEFKGKIGPQLIIAHFEPGGPMWEQIKLTTIGYPTGKQLEEAVTTLIHEMLHKLALSRTHDGKEIFPIEDFHSLCHLYGFEAYFEFETLFNKTTVLRKQITGIGEVGQRYKLGYKNYVVIDKEGRMTSYIPKDIIEKAPEIIRLLKGQGVEIAEDSYEKHILASPEEAIAIVGSEDENNFLERHGKLIDSSIREKTLQILQRSLLRSSYPVAERQDGRKIYEVYSPQGEKGLETKFVDESGKTFSTLEQALSTVASNTTVLKTAAPAKDAAHNGTATDYKIDPLFGYPKNTPLSDSIANLPADKMRIRDLFLESGIESQSKQEERLAVEMGVPPHILEPQVAWASQILTIKGYGPHNSGFDIYHEMQGMSDHSKTDIAWHSIDGMTRIPTPEEIGIIESVPGAGYDVFRNGIFVYSKGKTLGEVKAIFDEVAARLPDHGQAVRARFIQFGQVLKNANEHFIIKRELRNGKEYCMSREQYLHSFVSYAIKQNETDIKDVVSLSEEIVEKERKRKVDEEFIRGEFREAMISGKAVILESADVKNFIKIIKEILAQEGSTVKFGKEDIKVHAGFRLVFLLNDKEAAELPKALKRDLPQFDFPQDGVDKSKELMHELLNTEYWQTLSPFPQDEIEAIRSVPLRPEVKQDVEQYHRGKITGYACQSVLRSAFGAVIKTVEGKRALEMALKKSFPDNGKNDKSDGAAINKRPKNFKETRRLIQYMRGPGNEPKRIMLVLDDEIHWGDAIIAYRPFVASLLKTWKGKVSEIVIVSDYPEIFRGLEKVKVVPIKQAGLSDLGNFDLTFYDLNNDKNTYTLPRSFIEKYLGQDKVVIDYGYALSLSVVMKSTMSTLEAKREMIKGMGLDIANREEYIMRSLKRPPFKTVFVNFHGLTQNDVSCSMRQQWVQMINALLNKGYKVVVNKGRVGDEETSTFTRETLDQLSLASNAGNLESKAFYRDELLSYLEEKVDLVVTIDTGIFWAAQEILGLPSVVITGKGSYIGSNDKDGFRVIDYRDFQKNSLEVLEQIQNLADSWSQSSTNQPPSAEVASICSNMVDVIIGTKKSVSRREALTGLMFLASRGRRETIYVRQYLKSKLNGIPSIDDQILKEGGTELENVALLGNPLAIDTFKKTILSSRDELTLNHAFLILRGSAVLGSDVAIIALQDIFSTSSVLKTKKTVLKFLADLAYLGDRQATEALMAIVDNLLKQRQEIQASIKYSEMQNILNDILKTLNVKVVFTLKENACIVTAKGLIKAMGWGKERVAIKCTQEISESMARERFPGYEIIVSSKPDSSNFIIEFRDLSDYDMFPAFYNIPHFPFKFDLSEQISEAKVEKIREELNMGERQVIVLGSPSDGELEKIMEVYNDLYKGLPVDQRPLIIIAPRNGMKKSQLASIAPSLSEDITVVRTNKDRQNDNPFPDMHGKQVLLLNTMSELHTVYALGNACFVGKGHHIFEPASVGRPVLYFEGDWGAVNQGAKNYLVNAGGALVFNGQNLQLLMNNSDLADSLGEKGLRVIHELREKDIPSATNIVAVSLLANVLLKAEGISAVNGAVLKTAAPAKDAATNGAAADSAIYKIPYSLEELKHIYMDIFKRDIQFHCFEMGRFGLLLFGVHEVTSIKGISNQEKKTIRYIRDAYGGTYQTPNWYSSKIDLFKVWVSLARLKDSEYEELISYVKLHAILSNQKQQRLNRALNYLPPIKRLKSRFSVRKMLDADRIYGKVLIRVNRSPSICRVAAECDITPANPIPEGWTSNEEKVFSKRVETIINSHQEIGVVFHRTRTPAILLNIMLEGLLEISNFGSGTGQPYFGDYIVAKVCRGPTNKEEIFYIFPDDEDVGMGRRVLDVAVKNGIVEPKKAEQIKSNIVSYRGFEEYLDKIASTPKTAPPEKDAATNGAAADSAVIVKGIVRDGFLEPGLRVIMDNQIWHDIVMIIFKSSGNGLVYLASGYYADRDPEDFTGKKRQTTDEAVLDYLEKRYGQRLDRAIILPENPTSLLHEILHDVLGVSIRKRKELFKQLSDLMYKILENDERLLEAYDSIKTGRVVYSGMDHELMDKSLLEWIPMFFSKEIFEGDKDRRHYYEEQYRYLCDNMPGAAIKLFYELGFIWPTQSSVVVGNSAAGGTMSSSAVPKTTAPVKDAAADSIGKYVISNYRIIAKEGECPVNFDEIRNVLSIEGLDRIFSLTGKENFIESFGDLIIFLLRKEGKSGTNTLKTMVNRLISEGQKSPADKAARATEFIGQLQMLCYETYSDEGFNGAGLMCQLIERFNKANDDMDVITKICELRRKLEYLQKGEMVKIKSLNETVGSLRDKINNPNDEIFNTKTGWAEDALSSVNAMLRESVNKRLGVIEIKDEEAFKQIRKVHKSQRGVPWGGESHTETTIDKKRSGASLCSGFLDVDGKTKIISSQIRVKNFLRTAAVLDLMHGMGIGTRLLISAVKSVIEDGYPSVYWRVLHDNKASNGMSDKFQELVLGSRAEDEKYVRQIQQLREKARAVFGKDNTRIYCDKRPPKNIYGEYPDNSYEYVTSFLADDEKKKFIEQEGFSGLEVDSAVNIFGLIGKKGLETVKQFMIGVPSGEERAKILELSREIVNMLEDDNTWVFAHSYYDFIFGRRLTNGHKAFLGKVKEFLEKEKNRSKLARLTEEIVKKLVNFHPEKTEKNIITSEQLAAHDRCVNYIRDYLNQAGVKTFEAVSPITKEKSIIGVIGNVEDPSGKTLIFDCHYDVREVVGRKEAEHYRTAIGIAWKIFKKQKATANLFDLKSDEIVKRCLGPGIYDMLGSGAALLTAVKNIKNYSGNGNSCVFVFAPDEEYGGHHGTEVALEGLFNKYKELTSKAAEGMVEVAILEPTDLSVNTYYRGQIVTDIELQAPEQKLTSGICHEFKAPYVHSAYFDKSNRKASVLKQVLEDIAKYPELFPIYLEVGDEKDGAVVPIGSNDIPTFARLYYSKNVKDQPCEMRNLIEFISRYQELILKANSSFPKSKFGTDGISYGINFRRVEAEGDNGAKWKVTLNIRMFYAEKDKANIEEKIEKLVNGLGKISIDDHGKSKIRYVDPIYKPGKIKLADDINKHSKKYWSGVKSLYASKDHDRATGEKEFFGGTVARFYKNKGVDNIVIFGPTGFLPHALGEFVFPQSLEYMALTLKDLIEEHLSPSSAPAKDAAPNGATQKEYVDKNKELFKDMLGENKPNTLLRVPIEAIESVGIDNIKDFLETFQGASNGFVELYYMSGMGEVSDVTYQKYGLQKKPLPKDFKRTRENTVTLFPAFKGEEINQSAIISRLGSFDVTPDNTILSPIGLQHDPAGLIRATILGLKIMDIARQIREGKPIDKDAVHVEILNQLRNVLDPADFKNFDLTPDDIVALATGNINNVLTALKKLIRLLPITPIDADELRQIYEHVKAVITAA